MTMGNSGSKGLIDLPGGREGGILRVVVSTLKFGARFPVSAV